MDVFGLLQEKVAVVTAVVEAVAAKSNFPAPTSARIHCSTESKKTMTPHPSYLNKLPTSPRQGHLQKTQPLVWALSLSCLTQLQMRQERREPGPRPRPPSLPLVSFLGTIDYTSSNNRMQRHGFERLQLHDA